MKKLCDSLSTVMMRTPSSFSAQKARSFSVTMKTSRRGTQLTESMSSNKCSTKASTENPFIIKHWPVALTSLSLDNPLGSRLGRQPEAKALVIKFMDLSWDLRSNQQPSRSTTGRFRNLRWGAPSQIGTCLRRTSRATPTSPTLCRESTSCLRSLSKDPMSKTSKSEKTCLWRVRRMSSMRALEAITRKFSKKLTIRLPASFRSRPVNEQTQKTLNKSATSSSSLRCLLPSTKY